MDAATTSPKCYCNVLAMEKGLDPAGSAGAFDDAMLVETPLPWKHPMHHLVGVLPPQIIDVLRLWRQQSQAGTPVRHRPLMIAPDAAYSLPGWRRLMFFTRTAPRIAQYARTEYLVPEAELGPLVWAWYQAQDEVSRFDTYRVDPQAGRDLLVCTHGTIDAACAKFGFPLYAMLRQQHAHEHLRVWRVSHFGGHVFAPTLLDMPTGHYWAYVDAPQAAQIARQSGNVRDLYGYYRGWAGLVPGFAQATEREVWMQHGWDWFAYPRAGRILAKDATAAHPQWAQVHLDYSTPDGTAQGSYALRVEVRMHVHTRPKTADEKEYAYPQYVVTEMQRTSPANGL